jgi:hypothetical protein
MPLRHSTKMLQALRMSLEGTKDEKVLRDLKAALDRRIMEYKNKRTDVLAAIASGKIDRKQKHELKKVRHELDDHIKHLLEIRRYLN